MTTEHLKTAIETMYPMNACLLGEGYDNRLEYLKSLLPMKTLIFESGKEIGTWKIPDEWVVRDAWVKFKGQKIIDYTKDPLSLVVGSLPINKTVKLEEFKKHLHYDDDMPDAIPYNFKFYDKDWGFSVAKNKIKEKIPNICENGECEPDLKEIDPTVGKVQIEGVDYSPKYKDSLEEGDYQVFVDSEYRKGKMKIGVHTIKGETKKEVLIFAHLDHPFQANDNLSGVACLLDLAGKLKDRKYTVKLVFCPETIGSHAYALTQDISNVEFVIAVDICGNKGPLLLQKSFDPEHKLNRVAHLALQEMGETYNKSGFRSKIGSDEYVFNDPLIGIPGILLTRFPYKEYHTSADTPDKIDYDNITKTADSIVKILDIYEQDFIPKREFKGALMRSRYGVQSINKAYNLSWDYFIYSIDGKISLAELCCNFGLNFTFVSGILKEMENDKKISRTHLSEEK